MKLETKDYTKKEMAEWFGVSSSTFYNRKEHYLNLLRGYAVFEELKNKKIRIKEVFVDTYIKASSKSRQTIHDHYYDGWPNIEDPNTIRGVTTLIIEENKKDIEVNDDTAYKYVLDETRIRFGSAKTGEAGTDGTLKRGWCTLDKETNKIRFLTKEEKELYKGLKEKYYEPVEEQELITYQCFLQGECSQAEVDYNKKKKQQAFLMVRKEWKNITGQNLIVGTQLEPKKKQEGFFREIDDIRSKK